MARTSSTGKRKPNRKSSTVATSRPRPPASSPARTSRSTSKLSKARPHELAAHEDIVEIEHLAGVTYQRKYVRCGNPRCIACKRSGAHGPYWYAYWKAAGRTKSKYVGKHLPRAVAQALAEVERGRQLG